MIVVNPAGVITSPPKLVKEFKVDDKNYVYLHFHRLEDGAIVYGHGMTFDDCNNGSFSPACPDNEDRFPTLEAAVEHGVKWACDKLIKSNHPRTVSLLNLIRHESRQLDLFGEAV